MRVGAAFLALFWFPHNAPLSVQVHESGRLVRTRSRSSPHSQFRRTWTGRQTVSPQPLLFPKGGNSLRFVSLALLGEISDAWARKPPRRWMSGILMERLSGAEPWRGNNSGRPRQGIQASFQSTNSTPLRRPGTELPVGFQLRLRTLREVAHYRILNPRSLLVGQADHGQPGLPR